MKNINFDWFKAAMVRAIKTFAQTAVGMIAVGAAMSDIDWTRVCSVGLVAAVLSILTSVAGLPEVSYDGDFLVDTTGEKDIYRLDISDDLSNLKDKNRVILRVNPEAKLTAEDDINPKD